MLDQHMLHYLICTQNVRALCLCVCVQLTSLSAQDLAGSLQQKLSACFILPKMLCARG